MSAQPAQAQLDAPSLAVASEVRRLIAQTEQGQVFDFEMQGHAWDVLQAAGETLRTRVNADALVADLERRLEHFAQSKGSTQTYLRLVVTDIAPDLPDYDPNEVVIYDGTNGGTNFSTADMRFTNMGTVMTSVNVTDLRAYFESGKRRILVAYFGTDRDADLKALDKMLTALPDLLAAAGMPKAAIAEIITAIKSGNVPPAVMKMVQQVVAIAELKAQPPTQARQEQIVALQKDFTVMLAKLPTLPGIPPVFTRALQALAPQIKAAPRVSMQIRADNDNPRLDAKGRESVRELIKALRTLAKDKTNLTREQRREIAQVLRDLRSGLKMQTPTLIRQTVARLGGAIIAPLLSTPAAMRLMPALQRIAPLIIRTLANVTPPARAGDMRAALDVQAMPAAYRASIQRLDAMRPAALMRAVARMADRIPAYVPPRMMAAVMTPVLVAGAAVFAPAVAQARSLDATTPARIERGVEASTPSINRATPLQDTVTVKPVTTLTPVKDAITPQEPVNKHKPTPTPEVKNPADPVKGEPTKTEPRTQEPRKPTPPNPEQDRKQPIPVVLPTPDTALDAPKPAPLPVPLSVPAPAPTDIVKDTPKEAPKDELRPETAPDSKPDASPDNKPSTLDEPDCCRDKFKKAADDPSGLERNEQDGITLRDKKGQEVRSYTRAEVDDNIRAITAVQNELRMEAQGRGNTPTAEQTETWRNDTLRRLEELETRKTPKDSGHTHDEFCLCAKPPKGTDVTRDTQVTFTQKPQQPAEEQPPSRRSRSRTIFPT